MNGVCPIPFHSVLNNDDEVIINEDPSFVILFFVKDTILFVVPNEAPTGLHFASSLLSAAY